MRSPANGRLLLLQGKTARLRDVENGHVSSRRVWSQWEQTRRLRGKIVSYASDLVILLRPGRGERARKVLGYVCERLSLRLNETKTRLVRAEQESFGFLEFEIRKVLNPETGKSCPKVTPLHPRTSENLLTLACERSDAMPRGSRGICHMPGRNAAPPALQQTKGICSAWQIR